MEYEYGPTPFTKTRILIVEGKDEVDFFTKLLDKNGLLNQVDIRDAKGKDNFKNIIPALIKTTGFNKVEAMAIIRDADKNVEDAFKSIRDILKRENLIYPYKPGLYSTTKKLKIGIFILPDNKNKGMLEDLLLITVKNHEAMNCVDEFIKCTNKLKNSPKNISKSKIQSFLAAMPENANSIGIGAQKDYWDLNSKALKPLISFLKNLH